jgi:hypothetical protein
LNEFFYRDDYCNDDVDFIVLNLETSRIPKWQTFKFEVSSSFEPTSGFERDIVWGDGIEYYLGYIIFNPVELTIPK